MKSLHFFLLMLFPFLASSQAVVSILPPSGFAGNYEFTVTVDTELPWGVPDLEDPANAVIAPLVVARDGAEADSILCDEGGVVNVDEVTGKIALVYRNECFFDQKCLRAQNAGAVGVIIVNRLGADPLNMSSPLDGTGVGDQVTIPVVMVQGEEVINWRPEVDAGTMVALIGNKVGLFDNDLGISSNLVTRAEFGSYPSFLANADGYPVLLSGGIVNYGNNSQTSVSLSATVTKDGNELYNQTTDAVLAVAPGDTSFFSLPNFTTTYENGLYEVRYTINSSEEDEFPSDNYIDVDFTINDSIFSYGKIDPSTGEANPVSFYQPSGFLDNVLSCIHFQDANVEEVDAMAAGLTFAATYTADLDMSGVVVDVYMYEWLDEFVDINDPNFNISSETVEELTFGTFEYPDNELQRQNIYVPFEDGPIEMENDVRYLFCVNYTDPEVFTGFDNASTDYNRNLDEYLQPLWPLETDFVWTGGAFHFTDGLNVCPSYAVTMYSPLAVNDLAQQIHITPYPNPTNDFINVNLPMQSGSVLIKAFDVAGKQVMNQSFDATQNGLLRIGLADLDQGAYVFNLQFEDGSFSHFNVIKSK